ncbi:hypothetical protein JNK62_04655 [bacterium]|nr:hypothetical protein [bacterium]
MSLESRKVQSLILFLTALVCSRTMFVSFNDPEGPNLLVIAVGAVVICAASWIANRFVPAISRSKGIAKILLMIAVQAVVTTILYFALK